MKRNSPYLLLLSVSLFASAAHADLWWRRAPGVPEAQAFCARTEEDLRRLWVDPAQRLAFDNDGGLFGQGVCWWHSRLQRAALLLALFKPNEPRPDAKEAAKLVHALTRMKLVEIPGYVDFNSFSRDFHRVIQKELDRWQKSDGILRAKWWNGIRGRSRTSPKKLRRLMDRLYGEVALEHRLTFVTLQMPGLVAHAALVTEMEQTPQGYRFWIIDSNRPSETIPVDYRFGDTHFRYEPSGESYVPYIDFRTDLVRISTSILGYCGPHRRANISGE